MTKRLASKVLETARKIEDPEKRAAYLEAQFSKVDKPQQLVVAWLDALRDGPPTTDVGARARAVSKPHAGSAAFLTQLGCELDNCHYDDEAVEVLQMALAARGRSRRLFEALGRLLVLRGDASGAGFLEDAIEVSPAWAVPRIALAAYLVERAPERALALLEPVDAGYASDLRSMIYAATEPQRAAGELRDALEAFADDIEGRTALSEWHFVERRFARARLHAAALLERRGERAAQALVGHDLDAIDEVIVQAYRLGGGFDELVPWLRERCKEEVPPKLAWNIFYGLTSYHPTPDLALALRAGEAEVRRKADVDPDEARRWRVRIAGLRAEELGDIGALEALARDGLDDSASAWIELADQYRCLGYYEAAHASVDRALELDPENAEAIDTLFTIALATGDLEAIDRTAHALAAAEPLWHEGPEHLGRVFARRGDGAEAVSHARRATELAPHCHNAWTGLGEALLVAGHLAGAREAVTRSLALEAPQPGDDIGVLRAALARDPGALEAALGLRYRHLPALPFPAFVEKLRAVARSMP